MLMVHYALVVILKRFLFRSNILCFTYNNNIVFTSCGRTKSMSLCTLLQRISVNFNLNPFAPKCQVYKINVNIFQTMKTTEYYLCYHIFRNKSVYCIQSSASGTLWFVVHREHENRNRYYLTSRLIIVTLIVLHINLRRKNVCGKYLNNPDPLG